MQQSPVTKNVLSALKGADITSHDIAKIMAALLKKIERFDPEDVALCTGALLDKLGAIRLHDTIYSDAATGRMYIRGKLVKDVEVQKRILLHAREMRRNVVRKLVREKIEFMAAEIALHKSTSLWDIVFGKAALWALQEEDRVYEGITKLSGEVEPD